MKFNIPKCGDKITLVKDFSFTAHYCDYWLMEQHNPGYTQLGHDQKWKIAKQKIQHTIPAGTILEISKVYVRNFTGFGGRNYGESDYINFRTVDVNGKYTTFEYEYDKWVSNTATKKAKKKANMTFQVLLSEVSNMEF